MFKEKIKKADISLVFMILIVIIGCCLSLTAFFYAKQWEFEQFIKDEEKKADIHVRTLRQAFTSFGTILHSIGSLYNVYGRIERQDFSQFVKYQLANNLGIQALEWIPCVPEEQHLPLEEQVRQQGFSQFHFWQFSATGAMEQVIPRPVYYPVLHIEPFTENEHMLGYDVGSDKTLKVTLEKARDQGQLTTSGAIKIRTAHGELLGFRTFVPVYRRDSQPRTLEQRRQELIGFAVGVFSFDELAQTILRLPRYRTSIVLQIQDSTPGSLITELYAPLWFTRNEKIRSTSKEIWSTQVEFGTREWKIILTILPDGFEFQMWYAWGILGVGILFTLGLWRYMYIILTRARWAESLVAKRTQSLSKQIEARKQIAEALEESRQRFQAIFDEAATGIVQTDLTGKILDSNKAMQLLLDYSEEELQDRLLKELVHPEDIEIDKLMSEKMLSGGHHSYTTSKRYHDKYGNVVWTNQSCSIVRDTKNPFIISMIEDITERKCAEQARLEAEKKYRDIFENAIEGIFQCTPTGYFLSVNPAFVKMLGYSSAQQMLSEVTNIGQQLYVNPEQRLEFIKLLEKNSEVQGYEYEARCRDGQMIWVNETARVVRDEQGGIRYYESIVENVTERKLIEKKLRYDASHDPLTGLLNRAEFTHRLSKALARFHHAFESGRRATGHSQFVLGPSSFVVLFIDLDRFKIVNDSMGHLVGDKLLTEVAQRLKEQRGEYDSVARLGGDEFAMMMENLTDLPTLEARVEQMRADLSQPYLIEDETFNTTASIGIAFASISYSTANEILRDADTAMYEAKKHGRNKSVVFQAGMHNEVVNQLRMELDLRKAIERGEFILYYQPIVSLENRQTVGLEALIRWQHPEHGLIPPDKFIPLAEETGLIVEIGNWVFETACAQLRRWQSQFAHLANLGMNINVSTVQLKHPRLVRQIQDIIEKSGIKPSTCRVEITESAMMQDPKAALATLRELKSLEVLLYIDDFGTGYSSLSYLQKFPIDGLKIDKSFIHEIDNELSGTETTQAIIALGEAFKLRVVAEGVENDFQYQLLKRCRCHHAQGYLFSKPKGSAEIENYLSNHS